MFDDGATTSIDRMKSLALSTTTFFCRAIRSLLVVLLASSTLSLAQEPAGKHLYLVKSDGKWGYIDAEGKLAIEPQFDFAFDFSQGLALVIHDKTKSFIDATGKIVFHSPCLSDVQPFAGGFGRGSIGPEFFYFNRQGELLPHRFAGTRAFSQGRAAVCIDPTRFIPGAQEPGADRGRWGFIDETGALVIDAVYLGAGDFANGLAPVCVGSEAGGDTPPSGGKTGYINRQGKMVIEPRFDSGYSFSDGLALVKVNRGTEDDPQIWTGYIDTKGKYVIEPRKLHYATDFHDGLARIQEFGKRERALINHQGETVFEVGIMSVEDFSEGVAAARAEPVWDPQARHWIQKRKGYIDKTGKWLIDPQYYWAEPFQGGLARVGSPEEGQGYIDKSGKRVFWWR